MFQIGTIIAGREIHSITVPAQYSFVHLNSFEGGAPSAHGASVLTEYILAKTKA